MTNEWAVKRFWTAAGIRAGADGFEVMLDDRPVRTPAKALLSVPTRPLAEAIAAEWDAQSGPLSTESMPLTRAANAAIDKVRPRPAAVAEAIAAYGDTDLLCYRAAAPEGLVARQRAAWDPLLDWAAERLGARLHTVTGVMHSPQDARALTRLSEHVAAFDPFGLTALHELVSLSGSLVIGLAATEGQDRPEALWEVSRLDEIWQEEFWGEDAEAAALAARRRAAFLDAARLHTLSRD